MKTYLFTLWYVENNSKKYQYTEENFSCDADAQVRAREILKDSKRDKCGLQIDLFSWQNPCGWKHVVSYQ